MLAVGPGVWLARLNRRLIEPAFERYWGSGTVGDVGIAELGLERTVGDEEPGSLEATGSRHYAPSSWSAILLSLWLCRPGADDVLVDLGCGKGRVLLQAGRYRMRRIIGVDGSEQMAAVARENLARNRHRMRCESIEIEIGDLRTYELPGDCTLIFCFNSVERPGFDAMLAQMLDLARRRALPVRFIYNNSTEHETVMASGRARILRAIPANAVIQWPLHIYELLPD
jgi:SAM-dependent methyltransferase